MSHILRLPLLLGAAFGLGYSLTAFLAGLAVGYWNDQEEIETIWQTERVFEPTMSVDQVTCLRSRWAEALSRAGKWEPAA